MPISTLPSRVAAFLAIWVACTSMPAARGQSGPPDSAHVEVTVDAATVLSPSWAAEAVWYQVLVPRFCNGDPGNDPPGTLPWTADWAQLTPDERPPLRDRLLTRRYGGDLAGLRDRLPYLRGLGVNTLYLNPIFTAPSEGKYDTTDYRHIDDTLAVPGSRSGIVGETLDPATWQWSASDRMFLDFLAQAHRQGFRVVLDGVFGHVGRMFPPWQDTLRQGRASPWADCWFAVTDWGPPIRWDAWDGPNGDLPRFRHVGDGLHPDAEAFLLAIVHRWMDPDHDGDPSDGVDGWRLDAADEVPAGFWRRLRQEVRRINPQAILVGEIWSDGRPWLGGDQFDSVTNYRFAALLARFLAQDGAAYLPSQCADDLERLGVALPWPVRTAMMNLTASHDTERTVSQLLDPQRHVTPAEQATDAVEPAIPRRDTLRPDADARRRQELAACLQYFWPGAPLIYYGDEVGMFGGDDPFCRAPMWWPELGAPDYRPDLLRLYVRLARLRLEHAALIHGRPRIVLADDTQQTLVMSRDLDTSAVLLILNRSALAQGVRVNGGRAGRWVQVLTIPERGERPAPGVLADPLAPNQLDAGSDGLVTLACPPLSCLVLAGPAEPD